MTFLDRCKTAVAKWAGIIGLGSTSIAVQVRDDLPEGVLAMCSPSWEYDEALICFREGNYDLDAVAAHEVLHIPFALFNTQAGTWERRIEERLVETLSKAMVALSRSAAFDPARLATECRAMLNKQIRARRALAAGRYRMDPELAKLIMGLGAMLESEQVSGELRAAIEALVAKATGGAAEPPAGEPPATEEPPGAPAVEEPPMAPAMADPEENKPAPAARVTAQSGSLSSAARAAIAAAEKDAREAAASARAASEIERKRLALAKQAYREELFRSAPDVFPVAVPKIRETYRSAEPEEIERYIAAERARRAAPQEQQTQSQNGRARVAQSEPREPAPGGTAVKNEGGVVIRQAGKVVG